MRQITVSTDVFSKIWALRMPGEETEGEVLARVLVEFKDQSKDKGDGEMIDNNHNLRKPDTLRMNKKKPRWVDDIVLSLTNLGGEAKLEDIYPEIQKIRQKQGLSLTKEWRATVRRTLEDHSSDSKNFRSDDLFYMPSGKHKGFWGLR